MRDDAVGSVDRRIETGERLALRVPRRFPTVTELLDPLRQPDFLHGHWRSCSVDRDPFDSKGAAMIPVLRTVTLLVESGTFDRIQGIDDDLLPGAMIHELRTACIEMRPKRMRYLMQANDARAPRHLIVF